MTAHDATPGPWKLILHGNETYPFPLSIHTEDDMNWIARDGTVSSLANARLLASAPALAEENARLRDCLQALVDDFAQMIADPDLLQMALEMARMGQPLDFSDGGPETIRAARAELAPKEPEA